MTGIAAASPASDASLAALLPRFRAELARLWPEGGRLGIAVSGGPDSLALLALCQMAIPGGFEVACVDHALRAASAGECAMVADICAARAIPCAVLRVEVAGGNVQAQARAARYAALAGWADGQGLSAIATAHHADDQAETLLMRLNRGSGVAGLAGVRGRGVVPGSRLPLIRPLLPFRRAQLAAISAEAGFTPVVDPSNADPRFDRVRIRQGLAEADWIEPAMLAESAAHLADADEALAWAAERAWAERAGEGESGIRLCPPLPRAIALRLVERAIRTLGKAPRGADVARLLATLETGGSGNVGGVLAVAKDGEWRFRPEPPRGGGQA